MFAGPGSKLTAWLLALVASAGLLALGWSLGRDQDLERLPDQLRQVRKELAAEASRANQLQAQQLQMESRLARLQAELNACKSSQARGPHPPPPPRRGAPGETKVLPRGKVVEALEGRVALTLVELGGRPRQARIKIKVLGGQQGEAVLGVGGEARFHLDGGICRLLLRDLHTSSVTVSLHPE